MKGGALMNTFLMLMGAALSSFLGALVGAVFAWGRLRVENRQWQMDALVRGMGFMTGGRQQRSVGIGVIESLIDSSNVPPNIRSAVNTVLWNQLVYVMNHGDLKQEHERLNAKRLISLLRNIANPQDITGYSERELDMWLQRLG